MSALPAQPVQPVFYTLRKAMFFRMLELLEEYGIGYAILGNTATLPERIESDIDLVVAPKDLKKFLKVMLNERDVFQAVQVLQHEQTAYYLAMALRDADGLAPIYLHPDVCSDYYRHGRLMMTAKDLLKGAQPYSEECPFNVPAPAMAFMYYLLKRLDKGSLDHHHGEYLSAQFYQDIDGVMAQVNALWPNQELAITLLESARDNEWNPIINQLQRFRSAMAVPEKPTTLQKARETLRKIKRVLQPTGLCVSFLGPDGCGKSSVGEEVEAMLLPAFRRAEQYHLRPRMFSNPDKLGVAVEEPHNQKPRSPLGSVAKVAYLGVDYVLGQAMKIRPALVNSTFVRFDRHLVDLLIDPVRFRYAGPMGFARLINRLIPKPALFVLLDAPADVLQSRKQEVTPAESERQRQAYLDWAETQPNCMVTDATQPVYEVSEAAARQILAHMAQRTERRYGG